MSRLENLAISASAGSGKTFQLAHRYIRLMADDVPPSRIAALTFSRKAAGQILDSIITYLREGAASKEKARRTAESIAGKSFGQEDHLKCLRLLMENLHRIHIGTLDSFTIGIVRAFPFELGMGTKLEIMNDSADMTEEMNSRVLESIFNSRRLADKVSRAFLDALRQATYGQAEKDLADVIGNMLGAFQNYLLLVRNPQLWGDEKVIWTSGSESPWLSDSKQNISEIAGKLRTSLEAGELPDKIKESLLRFVEFSEGYDESSKWVDGVLNNVTLKQLVGARARLKSEAVEITYSKKVYRLTKEQGGMLFELLCHIFAAELGRALKKTRGIQEFLFRYERLYDVLVRRKGCLTFADAQYLLTSANDTSGGALISRNPDARLYIDYRLDCKLDHWLLDEFQDTSDMQWAVLENLADEVIQDESGRRSFFYVGDVKQAIYGWRGGNPRLFGNILRRYGKSIKLLPLAKSFRSCQAVIDTVNRVFSKLPDELPADVRSRWDELWNEHTCDKDRVPSVGGVALIEPPYDPDEGKPDGEDRYHVVAQLLKEIRPLNCGCSVAVLVRSNEVGRDVVNILRDECPGLTVVHEGTAAIKDNPVVNLLLSLVAFAAHPGDTFAWRHLEMSPLNDVFGKKRLNRDTLSPELLDEIQLNGFQLFVRHWGRALGENRSLTAFEKKRLDDLILAAGEYDAGGSRDCNGFLRFVDSYEVHDTAASNAVRVMTVHQAKGLEFDMVILPDLQSRGDMRKSPLDFLVSRDPETEKAKWILKSPRRIVAEADPVLADEVQRADAESCFEQLCALYVALTRARSGLYIVTSYPGKSSKALSPAALVKCQLIGEAEPEHGDLIKLAGEEFSCLFKTGNLDWCKTKPEVKIREPQAESVWPMDVRQRKSSRVTLKRKEPSLHEDNWRKAANLFDAERQDILGFGSAIHELYHKVEWIEDVDAERLISEWKPEGSYSKQVKTHVVSQFAASLRAQEVMDALSRPSGNVELWTEKRFDVVMDDCVVSGAFDRVTICRDDKGRPVSAIVVDYKSDRISEESEFKKAIEEYREQICMYAGALSRILKIKTGKITGYILFTRTGKVRQVV